MPRLHDFRQPASGAYTEMHQLLALRFAAQDLQLTPRRQSRSHLSGSARTRFRGRGMEFEEVRHYQAGDDIRNIDWRVTARTQIPHTKLFREERERPVILLVDQRSSMFFGSRHCFKSVLAAHLATLLGWTALANNDRIGALIFSDRDEQDVRPKRSRHSMLSILRLLHEFNQRLKSPLEAENSVPLLTRLQDLRRITRPGSALLIISDFHDLDSQCDEQLFQLSRHNDVSLVHVCDPLERQLPGNLVLNVSDGRSQRRLDTRSRDLRLHYSRRFDSHVAHLQSLSAQLALPLISAVTDQAPVSCLTPCFGVERRR